jgi:NAD(P)-dependent dehydrogenase (short-subunit alcohol dehydrogenase family)
MVTTIPEEVLRRMIDAIPLRRMGEPSEIADLVAYLASPQASYVTGQVVVIGGGRSLT